MLHNEINQLFHKHLGLELIGTHEQKKKGKAVGICGSSDAKIFQRWYLFCYWEHFLTKKEKKKIAVKVPAACQTEIYPGSCSDCSGTQQGHLIHRTKCCPFTKDDIS